jgi:hypothetical protein
MGRTSRGSSTLLGGNVGKNGATWPVNKLHQEPPSASGSGKRVLKRAGSRRAATGGATPLSSRRGEREGPKLQGG